MLYRSDSFIWILLYVDLFQRNLLVRFLTYAGFVIAAIAWHVNGIVFDVEI